MYEDGIDCENDRRSREYCNHHHDCYNDNNNNHNGSKFELTEWFPLLTILIALTAGWTSLNTTITKIEVNQINMKEDFKEFEDAFDEHNQIHLSTMKDITEQVNSLERSLTSLATFRKRS